jgi:hypothetical protein
VHATDAEQRGALDTWQSLVAAGNHEIASTYKTDVGNQVC